MEIFDAMNNIPLFEKNPITCFGQVMRYIQDIPSGFALQNQESKKSLNGHSFKSVSPLKKTKDRIEAFLKEADLAEAKSYFGGFKNLERMGDASLLTNPIYFKEAHAKDSHVYECRVDSIGFSIYDENKKLRLRFSQNKEKNKKDYILFDKDGNSLYAMDITKEDDEQKVKHNFFLNNKRIAEVEFPAGLFKKISLYDERGFKFFFYDRPPIQVKCAESRAM